MNTGSRSLAITVFLCMVICACSGSVNVADNNKVSTTANDTLPLRPIDSKLLTPRIRRTTGGVPHIDAATLAEAGAGLAYAQAEDNLCVLAEGFVKVRGERAAFFGPGPDNDYIVSDFSYRALGLRSNAEQALPSISESSRALIDGYVAGYNHFISTSDQSDWPDECQGQAWVRAIDAADLFAYYLWLSQRSSGNTFATGVLMAAVPPGVDIEPGIVQRDTTGSVSTPDSTGELIESIGQRLDSHESMLWENRLTANASNAWGIGSELSENGRGALLANPHFPYTGPLRLYQSHLTVGDSINVNGAGLLGTAVPLIAFNESLGWTHTISTSNQFTVYRLELDQNDPMAYVKDGKTRQISAKTIQINVANGTPTPTILERDVYFSEYGPMISLAAITDGQLPAWADGVTAYTYRDANANINYLDTWLGLAQAQSLDEFQAVFKNCGSTLSVSTTYADSDGNAFYIDSSAVPNLSADTLASIDSKLADPTFQSLFFNGLVLLDGTTSRDDWIEGECDSRVPYDEMPKLLRPDFVQNSNSSHWATNPADFLTGFSKLFGFENSEINERTRIGLTMLQNPIDPGFASSSPAGDDGKFNAQELLQVIWNNRAFYAEEFLPEVRERCALIADQPVEPFNNNSASTPLPIDDACTVLGNWSGTYDTDAVGAHLFRVMLAQAFAFSDIALSVEFDPADPVNTPAGLADANRGTPTDPVLQSILAAKLILEQADIPLNATLGSVQTYTPSGSAAPGEIAIELAASLPWHGGTGGLDGAFNAIGVVGSPVRENTILPRLSSETIPATGGLSAEPGGGWHIARGTSWHFGLQFNDDGPEAWGLTSYGQSTNPNLPWYTSQSENYSTRTPRQILFNESDIADALLDNGVQELSIEF